MPETGYQNYDFDQEPVAQRGDYLVKVPRGAIRHLEAKAKALDALKEAGVLDDLAAQAPAQPVDTPLEEGEADLPSQRRALAAGAPADVPHAPDPYAEARRIHDQVLDDGGLEKHALGAALNSVVNAAARGDRRVILGPEQERWA